VGVSEMSGLPSPSQPAGWGYSYLDWVGAYSFSIAILAGLLHRNRTGAGQWIDASQCEAGLFVTGTAVPDWSVNGRPYARTGNRSPYRVAAPHGIYRCDGWDALATLLRLDEATRARFATLATRAAAQDELDAIVTSWTRAQDPYEAMHLLQGLGIPAGVCQTAADRCDRDPQLAALNWLEEVEGTRIGTWPIPEVPAKLHDSPAYIGGRTQRGAPMYGEDNRLILGTLLNYSDRQIEELEAEGVI
jgi:crotonobetainyl-CoA:carnitine CoA-transferase CaiB-like acyl-CoA transferase